MYFPAYDIISKKLDKIIINEEYKSMIASTTTLCCTSLFTSPLSAIKNTNWNTDHHKKIFVFGKEMYKIGGIQSFSRGTVITLHREFVFGLIFGYFSMNKNKKNNYVADLFYGSIATIMSSPFNYVRTMIYSSPLNKTPTYSKVIKDLLIDTNVNCLNKNIAYKFYYIFCKKFRVGWGDFKSWCWIDFIKTNLFIF